jgi:Flp pilus assembly protein TadG
MNHKITEKGQALVIIAFAAVGLFAFSALAIDGSMVFSDKRHAQNAADTAAMAAALADTRGQNFITAAQERATSNGYDNNGTTNTVTISVASSPSGCTSGGKDIKVTIVSYVNTTFARIIGRNQVRNVVYATSRSCAPGTAALGPLYAGHSLFTTYAGPCTTPSLGNTGGDLQTWGGDAGSASLDPNCIGFTGNTQFKRQESGTACADLLVPFTNPPGVPAGTDLGGQDGCGKVHYGQSVPAPPADLNITCAGNATKSGSTLTPGNYDPSNFGGTAFPGGASSLSPGTYCVNGDFNLSGGSLTGNGVTIVMYTGGVYWSGSSKPTLSAPTSGPYKGLTIYAPPTNSIVTYPGNKLLVNGEVDASIKGTFLLQNLPCILQKGQYQKRPVQFICYTFMMTGGQIEMTYDASAFFQPVVTTDPIISLLE